MPYYDFIVKVWNMDLADLFGPYRKRDEPYIGSNSLKMFIVRPFILRDLVLSICYQFDGP